MSKVLTGCSDTLVMATPTKKKKPGVRLEDVAFYFDAVERDRLDSAGTSRKSGEVLALREKLLKLPDEEFEATLKTVKGLLTPVKEDEDQQPGNRRNRARQLFDQTRAGSKSTTSVGKVSAT